MVVHAGEHARGGGPGEGLRSPGVHRAPVGRRPEGRGVGVGDVHARVLGVAVHHGGKLLAGDRPVGPEVAAVGAGGVAGDDAGLHAPGHGRVVPGAALHVGEGGVARGGASRHAPQHRGDLGAREGLVGAEVARGPAGGRVGEARHEALVGGLVDPGGVPLPGRHVLEGRGLGGGGGNRGQAEEQRERGDEGPHPAEDTSPDLRGQIPARHSPAPFLAPSADGPSAQLQIHAWYTRAYEQRAQLGQMADGHVLNCRQQIGLCAKRSHTPPPSAPHRSQQAVFSCHPRQGRRQVIHWH